MCVCVLQVYRYRKENEGALSYITVTEAVCTLGGTYMVFRKFQDSFLSEHPGSAESAVLMEYEKEVGVLINSQFFEHAKLSGDPTAAAPVQTPSRRTWCCSCSNKGIFCGVDGWKCIARCHIDCCSVDDRSICSSHQPGWTL